MLPGIKQFDLTGRSAIITGGSKGLGKAMAAGLASAGASVLVSSRHGDEAAAAAEEIASDHGQQAISIEADVTSPEQVEAMVQAALDAFGKVDILIANMQFTEERAEILDYVPTPYEEVGGAALIRKAVWMASISRSCSSRSMAAVRSRTRKWPASRRRPSPRSSSIAATCPA